MPSPITRISPPDMALEAYDEVIDARAPVEYETDHITGAINLPVLSNSERERIGTQYTQQSAFDAQKAGAALVSINIGHHLQAHFSDKPKTYRPLIYCFRGGQRSRSLATVLAEIGWSVGILEGGYKAYRRHVLDSLETLPAGFRFRVLNGYTGSGKTLVLQALEEEGAQVLDLEGLANHRGSVFGKDLERAQPSQKQFETFIFAKLSAFDASQTIFVEAESPKIGRLNIPKVLWTQMQHSPVTEIAAPLTSRVSYLSEVYRPWIEEPDLVLTTIDRLKPFQSAETIAHWKSLIAASAWSDLVAELLEKHYDQFYKTDGSGYYGLPESRQTLAEHSPSSASVCAAALIAAEPSLLDS